MIDKVKEIITAQQKGNEGTAVFMVGEQLKDIAAENPKCAEILARDLEVDGMAIWSAEAAMKKAADKRSKGKKCVCVSPSESDAILREFYGLPARDEAPKTEASREMPKPAGSKLSLLDFM